MKIKKLALNFLILFIAIMIIAGAVYQIGYMRVGSGIYRPGEFFSGKVRDLALAAQRGDVAKINRLVKEGVDPNTVGKKSTTVLMWAVTSNNEKGVEALLKNGANPNYVPPKGSELEGESVTYLLAEGAQPNLLKIVLKNGGDPNVRNFIENNKTALIAASAFAPFENVKLLVNSGGNVDLHDNEGVTPLLYAAFNRNYKVVFYFLQNNANYKVRAHVYLTNRLDGLPEIIQQSFSSSMAKNEIPWRAKVIEFLEARGVKIDKTPIN